MKHNDFTQRLLSRLNESQRAKVLQRCSKYKSITKQQINITPSSTKSIGIGDKVATLDLSIDNIITLSYTPSKKNTRSLSTVVDKKIPLSIKHNRSIDFAKESEVQILHRARSNNAIIRLELSTLTKKINKQKSKILELNKEVKKAGIRYMQVSVLITRLEERNIVKMAQ